MNTYLDLNELMSNSKLIIELKNKFEASPSHIMYKKNLVPFVNLIFFYIF